MSAVIPHDFGLGLTLASGTIQAFMALTFMRYHRERPAWGLRWLGASYAMAALINLAAGPLMSLRPESPWFIPGAVVWAVLGVSCMATMTAGVRLYLGVERPRPWLTFGVVWLIYVVVQIPQLFGADVTLGIVAACCIYIYLGWLGLKAAEREPGVGHKMVAVMQVMYVPMIAAGALMGLTPKELAHWGVVPFTVAGLGLIAATMDRLQVALRELNATLEHRVQARTEQLQAIVADLESFNSMVSHDLRDPLGGVQGISKVAADALERGDRERALRLVRTIHTASSSLTALVSDLLTLAKSSHLDIRKQASPLQGIVTEALQWLEMSKGDGCTQPVRCENLDVVVDVDPALMRQVMVNLISNALKYSGQTDAPQVQVRARQVDNGFELTVTDNGVGFDPAQASNLFKPFRRLDAHGQFDGLGVGLTIVQRIIQGHGGRVWANASPGVGAQFHVWLPAPEGWADR